MTAFSLYTSNMVLFAIFMLPLVTTMWLIEYGYERYKKKQTRLSAKRSKQLDERRATWQFIAMVIYLTIFLLLPREFFGLS